MNTELQEKINKVNGRRKNRIIGSREIAEMEAQIKSAKPETHTIRVYSFDGFVPNSYKWRAPISYLEATRNGDEFVVTCRETDAKRSRGNGSLVTINGKAAE